MSSLLNPLPFIPYQKNNFILPYTASEYARIGMNDMAEEGVFVWEDGSPVSYLGWNSVEPNGNTVENCVSMYKGDGGFADIPCNILELFAICETGYSALFP